MAKRHSRKKVKKSPSVRRTTVHYFRLWFFSVFVGILVFTVGTFLFKPAPPCANSLSCKTDLTEKIENGQTGFFQGRRIPAPYVNTELSYRPGSSVLGTEARAGDKHIYVDLSSQTLYAYQGNTQILKTLISSGRWRKTPDGNFHIWEKLRATRMTGGSGDDAYDLPNVPYVMYFYNDFGLHGAYWHDNFGHTMSHGCVNMRPVDARALFDWVDAPADGQKGTAVSVCDSFTAPDICIQTDPLNS